jgi:uncharacterized protein (DUF433 family)
MSSTAQSSADPQASSPRAIVATPGTCGGKPRLDGTRIRVQDVAIWYERQAMSPDEIVLGWPYLTLADVHAALAYYYSHRKEIERDIQTGRELADRLKEGQPTILEKARQNRAGDDSLSPG